MDRDQRFAVRRERKIHDTIQATREGMARISDFLPRFQRQYAIVVATCE
jgi:hypothetical protein